MSFKKNLKYLWVFFFNIILILYLSELLLTIFVQPKIDMYLGMELLRYEKAKKMGVDFDKRSLYKAFFDEKKTTLNLSPKYRLSKYRLTQESTGGNQIQKLIKSRLSNNSILPLRGPINKKTLSCNEDGERKLINNDKNGFKNPNSIYEKKINIFLIGDSFAEGACLNEKQGVAGVLRNKFNINAANYGIAGAGPLLSLAVLKEYATHYKPNLVIYLYYEGNDMIDLGEEKKTFLIKYLNNYKQNLINKNVEIKKFLSKYEKFVYEIYNKEIKNSKEINNQDIELRIAENKKNQHLHKIKDFLELEKVKKLFFEKYFFNSRYSVDKELFTNVLSKMQSEVNTWNGEFIFIYLPTWSRYYQSYTPVNIFHKKKIEKIITSLNISYIDIVKEFNKSVNPINYYNLGIYGHYNADGYELVADSIFKNKTN